MGRIYELYAPCHFGMEAVLKREINDIGYDVTRTIDGRVYFKGDDETIVRANLCLRTAQRVMINVAQFKARTYDELFENVKAAKLEEFIPPDGKFWVSKAASIKSKLFSPSDIQSIVKKAMVDRLKSVYNISWFSEEGALYPFRVSIVDDIVTIGLDTSGESLHKRGYRVMTVKAPVTETLAAALIMLTPWKSDRILIDPFCGSGTFVIEAALMAMNIAPGLYRNFISQSWDNIISPDMWEDAKDEANEEIDYNVKTDIQGFDIDAEALKAARFNAHRAGVVEKIHFQQRDVKELSHSKKYGFIITNPPYGERLGQREELVELYSALGKRYAALDSWSMYIISAWEDTQKYIGKRADKNRKIYNGMMKTYFYQYMGAKPPKKKI
ncbi:hypothetical protein HMPREF9333_00119 [Johnsonella ignava ATCC 51276]|uniref:THUMP domain-containing protein n=1 Tax=Johnsonella ignava ATCC 51276 TaxID=679200 RepID=G5GEY1_9FIRM|nr:class I SAM-dependent RNA methyltransferase [Johnsonella ignava]EHI56672.1 hypothetical protein HMPREF9333_00119 [Johnsonella ignava ATCC 51276]